MKEILAKLVEGKDLTKEEAMKAQELILTGQATEAQIACFLTALRMKGETLDVSDLDLKKRKGWQLVCVDEYPLGWGKLAGGSLKNKYYAGWRWQ